MTRPPHDRDQPALPEPPGEPPEAEPTPSPPTPPPANDPFGTTIAGVVPSHRAQPDLDAPTVGGTRTAAGEAQGEADPTGAVPAAANGPAAGRRHRWGWPLGVAAAFLVGAVIGTAVGVGDPTASEQYQALLSENAELKDAVDAAHARAEDAQETADAQIRALEGREADLDARESGLDDRADDLDRRDADLDRRETAIAGAEAAVAETQIGIGTWTVGVDIEPGTYRTAEAVTSSCYWGIYRSGTNKADIIDNDIVQGGFPTVTLSEGQDFENGCGMWNKQ